MSKFPLTGVTYSCVGKGGLYSVVSFPSPAGVSKVFDPIVIYEDLRSGTQYWRIQGDFLGRREGVSGENTEEAMRSKTRY